MKGTEDKVVGYLIDAKEIVDAAQRKTIEKSKEAFCEVTCFGKNERKCDVTKKCVAYHMFSDRMEEAYGENVIL